MTFWWPRQPSFSLTSTGTSLQRLFASPQPRKLHRSFSTPQLLPHEEFLLGVDDYYLRKNEDPNKFGFKHLRFCPVVGRRRKRKHMGISKWVSGGSVGTALACGGGMSLVFFIFSMQSRAISRR